MEKNSYFSLIEIGAKLLVVLDTEPDEYYDSRIDHIDDRNIYILYPTKGGVPIAIRKDSVLKVSVITENDRIAFHTIVLGKAQDASHSLIVKYPAHVEHEQMRQFFRISVLMKTWFFIGTMDEFQEVDRTNMETHECTLDNLSAGGCTFFTGTELEKDAELVINFSEIREIPRYIAGRVLRIRKNAANKFITSVEFHNLGEHDIDRIVKYVLVRQLELNV